MEIGYAFLNVLPGKKKEVLEKVRRVRGVKEANVVLGIFDIIVRLEADTIEELEKIFFNELEKIEGIINARLHIVACERMMK